MSIKTLTNRGTKLTRKNVRLDMAFFLKLSFVFQKNNWEIKFRPRDSKRPNKQGLQIFLTSICT